MGADEGAAGVGSPEERAADGRALPRQRRELGRDLPIAILVGVTLALLFVGTLVVHPYAFLTFVAALVVVAVLELDAAFRARGVRPATPVVLGAGLVAFYGAFSAGPSAQSLAVVLAVIGTLAWALVDRDRTRVSESVGASLLVMLWVPFCASYIGLLLARDDGRWLVAATIALTVTNDIAAYAWGNRFGRHRLAPSVSPAKTWEGALGGLVTVLVLAGLGTARIPGFDGDAVVALVFGAGIVVAATIGDLAESLVKRDLGVKDLGTVLPGHGGVMDRVDAMVFTLPVAHLLLLALGR